MPAGEPRGTKERRRPGPTTCSTSRSGGWSGPSCGSSWSAARPGTGKSTLAAGLGEVTGWPVLRSDVVRRELTPGAGTGELDRGRYAPEVSERVLAELLARLAELLGAGRSAVLDAT